MSSENLSTSSHPTGGQLVDEEINVPYGQGPIGRGQDDIHGLLVRYSDDQLNANINQALSSSRQRFKQVYQKYRCLDTHFNLLAFGTSAGVIYLFRLEPISHASCTLVKTIHCDQGSIEAIKFLSNSPVGSDSDEGLALAVGTSRGSLVVLSLVAAPGDSAPICHEIYKAESFTSWKIKFIECDQDLFDPQQPFTRLYICDDSNQLYQLDGSSVFTSKPILGLIMSINPVPIYRSTNCKINQINVHRGQILISTDETTRLLDEQSNQLKNIGLKKRKAGFYGASFFNPNYAPLRLHRMGRPASADPLCSTTSLYDTDQLLMFVSRPNFRLWHVDHKLEVKFTHNFKGLIKDFAYRGLIELPSEPLAEGHTDCPMDVFSQLSKSDQDIQESSDHFERLVPIYSSTLGNLILAYNRHELIVLDPMASKLIAWYNQDEPIIQVSCNENELFVCSQMPSEQPTSGPQQIQFHLKRLVLLAPTQFVLELHRLRRFMTLTYFVQTFLDLFKHRMALPLTSASMITTEGGLLRNIVLNAWDMLKPKTDQLLEELHAFKQIAEEIVNEGQSLRRSLENINDSRFFLTMTNENIDRLCSEPYLSLVSLEVSIAELHSNHVIRFSEKALNRHKSVANLSENIRTSIDRARRGLKTKSNFDLALREPIERIGHGDDNQSTGSMESLPTAEVKVIRQKPKRKANLLDAKRLGSNGTSDAIDQDGCPNGSVPLTRPLSLFSVHQTIQECASTNDGSNTDSVQSNGDLTSEFASLESNKELEEKTDRDMQARLRCSQCLWPRRRSHLYIDIKVHTRMMEVQNSLMHNFEENIDKIEQEAFKHGLWRLYARCLAQRDQLQDHITCCMMLDDISLLNSDLFVIRYGEEKILERILENLSNRINLLNEAQLANKQICLNCSAELACEQITQIDEESMATKPIDAEERVHNNDDELSFTLINVLKHFLMRRNANVKRIINRLLKYPKLLNESEIPPKFYLNVIDAFVKQSPPAS